MTEDPMHAFLRTEFQALRSMVHEELAAMNANFASLTREVRAPITDIAVLNHRADAQQREIDDLKRARDDERTRTETYRRSRNIAVWAAALGAVVTIVGLILNVTLGG